MNKKNGFVGRHSGWRRGGTLHSSAFYSRPEVVGAQNDQVELDESQGGKDDDAEQPPRPHAGAGTSKALKRANEQFAAPKGKGRADQIAQHNVSKPPKSQGGKDDHAEESAPPPARATRLTAPKQANKQFADPKRKLTLRPDPKADTPVRTS